MSDAGREERRCSFGGVAGAYERGRPEYPAEAVAWLLDGCEGPVLDVGAGTGKLTRALLAAGRDVVAVEPDAAMRQAFALALAPAPIVEGRAERLSLASGSFAVVTAGQAFHWFQPGRALPELARVLQPTGRLAVIWNFRDESVAWVAELGRVLRIGASADALVEAADDTPKEDWAPWFEPVERATFVHEQLLDVATLVDLAASRSHTATLAEATRGALLAAVEHLGNRVAVGGIVRLPYRAHCLRARRR